VREVLARTPLSIWPVDLASREVADGWATDLHTGLAHAARDQDDAAWADRLFPVATSRELTELLYPTLTPQRRVDAVTGPLRDSSDPYEVARLLDLCPTPWPVELAAAVIGAVERFARAGLYGLEPLCRLAALHLPVRYADAVANRVTSPDDQSSYQSAQLRRLADTLRLRSEMHREFTQPSKESA
jgi:hypothetical protein